MRYVVAESPRAWLSKIMPQRAFTPLQRLREHLEDALAEADAMERPLTGALICDALGSLDDNADQQPHVAPLRPRL